MCLRMSNEQCKNLCPEGLHSCCGQTDSTQNKYIKYKVCQLVISAIETNKAEEWARVLLQEEGISILWGDQE